MPSPGSDEVKRAHWPPPIWSANPKKPEPAPPDPPISRYVTLPERVSVAYLAELTGQDVPALFEELRRLRVYVCTHRGVVFEDAAKFLRKYGIWATKID
jgi:hypothetical protein